MENCVSYEGDLNLKATELRLGLPGTEEPEKQHVSIVRSYKRASPDTVEDGGSSSHLNAKTAPAAKAQVVGWPPIRSYRKNSFLQKKNDEAESGMYVKVSMDGAPYLRKIDLKVYQGYPQLLKALENMFKLTIGEYSEREGYNGSEYAPTYEDKDGDWMLVGDVPWDMFFVILQEAENNERVRSQRLGKWGISLTNPSICKNPQEERKEKIDAHIMKARFCMGSPSFHWILSWKNCK